MASLICIIVASSILKPGCCDSSIRVNFWLLVNLDLCGIDILPLGCYSQTDQVRGINRCQKLRTTSDYHFVRTTHVSRDILRWCKTFLLKIKAKIIGKRLNFSQPLQKKVLLFWSFYYYGFLLNKNPWSPPNRLLFWSFLLLWSLLLWSSTVVMTVSFNQAKCIVFLEFT